jgi:hypothetical protein
MRNDPMPSMMAPILVLLVSLSAAAFSQDAPAPPILTLGEAISLAFQQNRMIHSSALEVFKLGSKMAASCSREEPYENPPTPVGVTTVQMFESANEIRYSASVIPDTQVDLAFKSGGYVDSIRQVKGADGRMRDLQQGDRVSNDSGNGAPD